MTSIPVTSPPRAGSRAWLLADTPLTRTQAVWGRRYRIWLGLLNLLADLLYRLLDPRVK